MFQLRYGGYAHDEAECTVSVSKQTTENEAGQRVAIRNTWNITGRKYGETLAELIAAKSALEAAYSFWYRDLVLIDTTTSIVVMSLTNLGSLTGVQIQSLNYPTGEGAQFSTFFDYTITATAEYPAEAFGNALKSFNETVQFSGGGPRIVAVECVNVPPQIQIATKYTAYRAVQSGQAVGQSDYPPIPAAIFPNALEQAPVISRGSPRLSNGRYTDFPVSWSYQFVSATPLLGNPNRWPAG